MKSPDLDRMNSQSPSASGQTKPATSYFRIYGLNCPRCANRVHAALIQTAGVVSVIVEYTDGLAEVIYDPRQSSVDDLIRSVQDAGDGVKHNYHADWIE